MTDEIGFLLFTIALAALVAWHHFRGLPAGVRDLLGDEENGKTRRENPVSENAESGHPLPRGESPPQPVIVGSSPVPPGLGSGRFMGSSTTKVEPWPTREETTILPPCSRTIF